MEFDADGKEEEEKKKAEKEDCKEKKEENDSKEKEGNDIKEKEEDDSKEKEEESREKCNWRQQWPAAAAANLCRGEMVEAEAATGGCADTAMNNQLFPFPSLSFSSPSFLLFSTFTF